MTDADALRQLRDAWLAARDAAERQWNRTLPFAEYVVDRWEKARLLGFGEGASIYDSAVVLGTVSVGAQTWIGPWVMLDGSGGLSIGSYCSISAGVQIYSHDSVKWATSGGHADIERAPTRIGNNCYIGPNVIIAKGVSVGDGCIIGANSVVLRDVPSGVKAFGNPCRPIGVMSTD
jgi:acetyltransferase-like isoleucine patch superfamily enzyme